MKPRHFIFITMVFLVSSCASSSYFQLYETESNSAQLKSEGNVFENDEIMVIYNFWDDAGNSSFLLFNKTDSDVYVNLKKSHLILNGLAQTYFQNREFSRTSASSFSHGGETTTGYYKGISNTLVNSFVFSGQSSSYSTTNTNSILSYINARSSSSVAEGYTVNSIEQDIICIPPNAAKAFTGFSLKNSLFRDCDLLRFPSRKEITSKKFNQNSSPLTIKNIISYGFSNSNSESFKSIESEFWVSEVTNYPKDEFIESKYPEFCEDKADYQLDYYIYDQPDRFYIHYKKGTTTVFDH